MRTPSDRDPAQSIHDGPETTRPGRPRPGTDASFVVQISTDATDDEFRGRVQHLATLDGGNFSSPDSMIAILRRVLERLRNRQREDDEPERE